MPEYQIEDYQFGKITVDGVSYTKDLIILLARIISGWWRIEGHVLHVEDLQDVLNAKPQVLVIGQGAHSRMQIDPEVVAELQAAGIEWVALPTGAACQEFNRRAAEGEAAAALHLTC